MRIIQSNGVVTATDTPGLHWLLGGLLATVGAVFVAATLGLADNAAGQPPGVRAFAGLAGPVGVIAGLGVIRAAPRIRTEFDTTAAEVRVRRGRGAVESFPLGDIEAVELDQSKDGDGNPVYRPALRLRGGGQVLLASAWMHHGPREAATELAALLGVPGPAGGVASGPAGASSGRRRASSQPASGGTRRNHSVMCPPTGSQ